MTISYFFRILDVTGINSQVVFISSNTETTIAGRLHLLRGMTLELLKSKVAKRVTRY